jgi:hypothetical protein
VSLRFLVIEFKLTICSHMGFEELSMRNIDAVLKGKEPLTPVNAHLMAAPSKAKL